MSIYRIISLYWGEGTLYVSTLCVRERFAGQFDWLIIKDLLVFALIYCSGVLIKVVNLTYCFKVQFWINWFHENLGKHHLRRQYGISGFPFVLKCNMRYCCCFFSSFYWWHLDYKGWMYGRLLNLQDMYISGQNICIEIYGNSIGTFIPNWVIVTETWSKQSVCIWLIFCPRQIQVFSSSELKAHWWAYRIGKPLPSVVRPSVCLSVCLSSTLFKHLLLRNHWADWSQILYGVSMG